MKKAKVDLSKMNRRITIQKGISTKGEWNQTVTVWEDFITLWASIDSLSSREFWEAKQANLENLINITVRYQRLLKDIDIRECRVKFEEKIYNIINVDNPQFENKYLIFKCVKVME